MIPQSQQIQVVDLEIIHSCLEKGVALLLHLNASLDVHTLDNDNIDQFYVVETTTGGFFRFNLNKIVTVTGVLGEEQVRVMFVYFRTAEALAGLEHLFPGIEAAYELTFNVTT